MVRVLVSSLCIRLLAALAFVQCCCRTCAYRWRRFMQPWRPWLLLLAVALALALSAVLRTPEKQVALSLTPDAASAENQVPLCHFHVPWLVKQNALLLIPSPPFALARPRHADFVWGVTCLVLGPRPVRPPSSEDGGGQLQLLKVAAPKKASLESLGVIHEKSRHKHHQHDKKWALVEARRFKEDMPEPSAGDIIDEGANQCSAGPGDGQK